MLSTFSAFGTGRSSECIASRFLGYEPTGDNPSLLQGARRSVPEPHYVIVAVRR